MNRSLEYCNIAARTDGSIPSGNSFAERTGIIVSCSNDGEQISIQQFSANNATSILAQMSCSLTTGQSYSFLATLNARSLTLSVNGILQ